MTDIFFPGGTKQSNTDDALAQYRQRMLKSLKRKNTGREAREWAARLGIKHIHSIGWGCHEGCTDGLTPPVHDPSEKRPFGMKASTANTVSQQKSARGKKKTRETMESKRRMARELANGGYRKHSS